MGRTVAELMSGNISNAITNVQTWSGITINVKEPDYGAKGDGVNNDTEAFQSAINYAVSIGKRDIWIPAGIYKYDVLTNTEGITFYGDGVTLIGTTKLELVNLNLLKNVTNAFKPYDYIDFGMAFDSNDPTLAVHDRHASWTHGNVAYDTEDDKVIVFYDVKPGHVLDNNRVLMRKKDPEGEFSAPYIVADRMAEGISCKTQASGIVANGDYISLVYEFQGDTGLYVYRSLDKGYTWGKTKVSIGGISVTAFNGDVTGFLVLKSGRILSLVKQSSLASTLIYSDDHGYTWSYINQNFDGATEPAWCELSDGTVIAYLRKNVDGIYGVKTPAKFMKSTDGGMTWTPPVDSTTILDFTNSNGHLIFHEDSKMVELIHHSRFMQPDGFASLYVSVATEEDAKNDGMGKQIRISKLSPQTGQVNGSTGDSGYVGAAKDKYGTIHAFYYNGTMQEAQICYLVGKKTKDNVGSFNVDHYTGKNFKDGINFAMGQVTDDQFEPGGINTGIGERDTLNTLTNRIRQKKVSVVFPRTNYNVNMGNSNFQYAIRQYDKDFLNLSDSGWLSGNTELITLDNAYYVKLLVRKADNSTLIPSDIPGDFYSDLYNFEKVLSSVDKLKLYSNGNEFEFETGLFQDVLTSGTGSTSKNASNMTVAVGETTVATVATLITTVAVDVTKYSLVKAKVINSAVTGVCDSSIRLYTKNNPIDWSDGRVGISATSSSGRNIITLPIPAGYSSLYVAVAASTPGGVSSSITANFYEVWLE